MKIRWVENLDHPEWAFTLSRKQLCWLLIASEQDCGSNIFEFEILQSGRKIKIEPKGFDPHESSEWLAGFLAGTRIASAPIDLAKTYGRVLRLAKGKVKQ